MLPQSSLNLPSRTGRGRLSAEVVVQILILYQCQSLPLDGGLKCYETKSFLHTFARELRNNTTDVERILWRHLRSRRRPQKGYAHRNSIPLGIPHLTTCNSAV